MTRIGRQKTNDGGQREDCGGQRAGFTRRLSSAVRHPDHADAFHAVVRSRRSIRNFRSDAIPHAILERLFTSAAAAPSAHNRQPWRFFVIDDAPAKAHLALAMGTRLARDRRRDGDATDAIVRDVARSYSRITGAPVLILVSLTLEHADVYPDAKRREAEFLMAVQGTAMAAQNLLLGAHAEGLAACWMCAPLFCPNVVRKELGLPAHWQPQGLIALGIAADAGRARERLALEEFVVSARDLARSRDLAPWRRRGPTTT